MIVLLELGSKPSRHVILKPFALQQTTAVWFRNDTHPLLPAKE